MTVARMAQIDEYVPLLGAQEIGELRALAHELHGSPV